MSYLPESGWARIAVITMYAVIGYAAVRLLLPLILPFLIAWVIALVMQIPVRMLSKAAKIKKAPAAFITLIAVMGIAGFGIYLAAGRVAREIVGVGSSITGWTESAASRLGELADRLGEKLPLPGLTDSDSPINTELVSGIVERVTGELAAGLSSKLPGAVSAIPGGFFTVIITIIAAFYITADFDNINRRIMSILPRSAAIWLDNCRSRMKSAWLNWLRACIMLMAVTFAELFCGFLILDIDYAFTIALLCAIADLLPVIGVGTILIPWSAILLLGGSYYKGIGLLIIWGVSALIRQILEPRIVGGSIGLDPLITLAAMYAGWKLAGIWGMICAPVLAMAVSGGTQRATDTK